MTPEERAAIAAMVVADRDGHVHSEACRTNHIWGTHLPRCNCGAFAEAVIVKTRLVRAVPRLLAALEASEKHEAEQAALLRECRDVLKNVHGLLGRPHPTALVDAWWGLQAGARPKVAALLERLEANHGE